MILLVEDNAVARNSTMEILAHKGFSVRDAATYVEAVEEIRDHCPDILVIDQILPCNRYGTELLELPEVKERWGIIKVIVTTALTEEHRHVPKNLPPNTIILTKPFKIKE